MALQAIKVLVVDDSALVREILVKGLSAEPGLEVVGSAADPYAARDKIVLLKPDVLTLDVEMPRMDGVEFLRRLMPQHPIPVVMVSALTKENAAITLQALAAGAVDFVTKPKADVARGLEMMLSELCAKIKIAAKANVRAAVHSKRPTVRVHTAALPESTDKVIAIGASTGGTEAIRRIIKELPAAAPGIVIVQHMPPGFTSHFAAGLNAVSRLEVMEAQSGDRVLPGRALIAPGGQHMKLKRSGGVYVVECAEASPVNGHCPSVDVLFNSVALQAGANAMGIILTGMGADGAAGLLAMRQQGALTIGQDESTSVVYGMPKVAYEQGGVQYVEPLERIPAKIVLLLQKGSR